MGSASAGHFSPALFFAVLTSLFPFDLLAKAAVSVIKLTFGP
jgi:hypothetical protein